MGNMKISGHTYTKRESGFKLNGRHDYSLFNVENRCKVEGCDEEYYGKGFCKKHHQWHWARGMLDTPETTDPKEIIEMGSIAIPEAGCWIWVGPENNRGYGKVSIDGEKHYVHRLSYQTYKGKIPEYFVICHSCDNPICCNPDHLWLGTMKDNSQDCVKKGRRPSLEYKYGTDHHQSVLTFNEIERILTTYKPATHLAKEIGVAYPTIHRLRQGKTYKKEFDSVEGNLYAE